MLAVLAGGCAHQVALVPIAEPPHCAAMSAGAPIAWLNPREDRRALDAWCAAVGAPIVRTADRPARPVDRLAVVAWNLHEGAGRLPVFLADLRSGRLTGGTPVSDFVLLVQEAYRSRQDEPVGVPGARWAAPIQPGGAREGIVGVAGALHLWLFYVPSMSNGPPALREDRGNAILSTLPLDGFEAVELPMERQRRVAVAALITGRSTLGRPWTLRLVSVHLSNMVAHHLWIFSEAGRARQAHALAGAFPDRVPTALGGDLNTWFGFSDGALGALSARFSAGPEHQDRRPTFWIERLDHLLFDVPPGWEVRVRRASSRYGSDHYPLIALITPAG
ncbi:MAG TPA: endonuclease/exonuclease/phosphatase family protein [Vicinamibacterales bacterium]|nr:endonuclease/exonuclease/phosphatase family protein [Vicinamibacterales bacterium]